LAIQVLFHLEFSPGDSEEVFDLICDNFHAREPIRSFAKTLVVGVCENKEDLDRLITRASKNWRLERMPRLDRCILRLAVLELLNMEDIPPKVSIDEAVELGKRYGAEDSSSFINGVLDKVYTILAQEGRLKGKNETGPIKE